MRVIVCVLALMIGVVWAATNREIEALVAKMIANNPSVILDRASAVKRETVRGLEGWEKVDVNVSVRPKNSPLAPISQMSVLFTSGGFAAFNMTALGGGSNADIERHLKEAYAGNSDIKIESIKVDRRIKIKEPSGFEAVVLTVSYVPVKSADGKALSATPVFFVSASNFLTDDFFSVSDGKSVKNLVKGEVKDAYYRNDHLLYGKKGAKNKIIVFSDPLCPACRQLMPRLFEAAENYPDDVALYYYSLPTHISSPTLIKAAISAHQKGGKNTERAMYEVNLRIDASDEQKVLDYYNSLFKSKLTLEDINAPKVLEHYAIDEGVAKALLVNGTPTLFINGVYDSNRDLLEKVLNELKASKAK
ncbi:MAG: thioredoxin domain-containing protein [Helicobacteraceae bacterium]|jgi:protein-disulfide isomerase|nr:thioredoxin domain-containing protein [Helicobacteraceae bacterium]